MNRIVNRNMNINMNNKIQQIKRKILMIKRHNIKVKKNLPIIKKQILYNFKNIENYLHGDTNKNTVLLIEPRFKNEIIYILANAYNKLGNNWNYVFYCGKSFENNWKNILPNFIEIRPLENDNFDNTKLYSDFCKKKELWESLYGKHVLTIQLDTWIMNREPYNISFFINLNKSYIGGNMEYKWGYFDKINLHHANRNFNGGLSLRNRIDMLKVIEKYPPLTTLDNRTSFLTEHEDVYFTFGCIELRLPIGDDIQSSFFSLHSIYRDKYFGIHQPSDKVKQKLRRTNPYLKYINTFLGL